LSLKNKLLAFMLLSVWWILKQTYSIRYFGAENKSVAKSLHPKGVFALTIWHENIFTVTTVMAGERIAPLASKSKDGDFVTYIFDRIGFSTARGSSSKGGREGLRELLRKIEDGYIPAISVDGPLGPRRKAKQGVVQVSKRGRIAILPTTAVADRMWVFTSWDKFRLPKPFARIAVVYDKPLSVENEDSGDVFDTMPVTIEQRLNAIEDEARHHLSDWNKK